jgi:hypothetical protein
MGYSISGVIVKACVHKGLFDPEERANFQDRFFLLKKEDRYACFEVARDGSSRHLSTNMLSGSRTNKAQQPEKNFYFPHTYEKRCKVCYYPSGMMGNCTNSNSRIICLQDGNPRVAIDNISA